MLRRRERSPHKRTSVEWQKGQAETAIYEATEIKTLAVLSLQLVIVDAAGPIYHYSLCIMYVCGASSRNEEGPSRSLLIPHIPRRFEAS